MSGIAKRHLSSSYMAALAEAERTAPVLDWRFGGVALWPLLRVRWMFAEWTQSEARQGSRPRRRLSVVAARAAEVAVGPLRAWAADHSDRSGADGDPSRRDVVFLSDGISFASLGGRWVERFCDPVASSARAIGLRTATWTPLHRYLQPRGTPSTFVQPAIDRANLIGLLAGKGDRDGAFLPGHEVVVAAIRRHGFGTTSLDRRKIDSDGRRLLAVSRSFELALQRTRPRLAFVVSYYGLEGFAFILACRRLGILSVDLQHGVQGPHHPAYAAWPRPAASVHQLLPDRFWVWSERERQTIDAWSAGTAHRALVGGNPWLEPWSEPTGWPGIDDAMARADTLAHAAAGRTIVLVTLQFGLADAEQLEPLRRLIAADCGRSAFWVRLHPVMLDQRERVRSLLGRLAADALDAATDLPLQALLGHADVHLTHSSSAVIEAAASGVHSVITSAWGAELYESEIARGTATFAGGDVDAVVRAIDHGRRAREAGSSSNGASRQTLERLLAELRSPASTEVPA